MFVRLLYPTIFITVALAVALAPFPGSAGAFGNEWVPYTYGAWDFNSESHPERWQEVIYQGQQRISTGYYWWFGDSGIRLWNTSTGSGFPLVFDSECTPDTGSTCNVDGHYIGHNGNTANPSPLPARDYYNNHDESWSWYRNADWAVDFRFRGRCASGDCSGLGNNFLYSQTRENITGFAVGYNMYKRQWFYTHDNNTTYVGSYNTNAHTGHVKRIWARWYFAIDWLDHMRDWSARQTSPDSRGDRIMTNLNLGNLQQINGQWPEISLDYVNISYALPDGCISTNSNCTTNQNQDITTRTGGAPVSPGPPAIFVQGNSSASDIRVNTWSGDIRGVGTVSYYANWNTSGNSSGSWWNFANQNGSGSQSFQNSAILDCSVQSGFCYDTHLIAVNTSDVYGNLRQQWNYETRLQRQVRWETPPTPTPTRGPVEFRARLHCPNGSTPPSLSTSMRFLFVTHGGSEGFYFVPGPDTGWVQQQEWWTDGGNPGVISVLDLGSDMVQAHDPPPSFWIQYSHEVRFNTGSLTPGGRYEILFLTNEGCATPTPRPTPTPTPTNTPTPTSTPYLVVRLMNPQGSWVTIPHPIYASGGDGSQLRRAAGSTYGVSLYANLNGIDSQPYIGAYVDLSSNRTVFMGIDRASSGGSLNRWNNSRPNYSWPRWYTGRRQVDFILATSTRTPTPTNTPTPTPTPIPPEFSFTMTCPDGSTPNLPSVAYQLASDAATNDITITGSPNSNVSWWPDGSWGMIGLASDSLRLTTSAYNVPPEFNVFMSPSTLSFSTSDLTPGQRYDLYYRTTSGCATPTPTPTNTPTSTPTPTPTNTPSFAELHPPQVTPVAYIDTTNVSTSSGGGPTPVPKGLSLSDFYFPLQVWLQMIPTVGIWQPAEWCVGACYEADSRPVSYTYLGMSREDGHLVATTPYSRSFDLAAPYAFDATQHVKLFWEFPNIDDQLGLSPPRYYYTEQVPGSVDFHYRVRLRHTWSAVQTASWPPVMSPMPPCPGWGGPGTECSYEETITIGPAETLQLRMNLLRPVIERIE